MDGVITGDYLGHLATDDRHMANLALNSGLWVLHLIIGWCHDQGRKPASEVNAGTCPENQSTSLYLNAAKWQRTK
jgi:hypothetical protein